MLILSRVCAEFHDRAGKVLFTIYPHQRYSFLDAPENIREDPLFGMLLADGSLEAVRSVEQLRTLEPDPLADTTAEGKRKPPEADPASVTAIEEKKTRKASK